MARPANPNKEKIAELKSEIRTVSSVVKDGKRAEKKLAALEEKLQKLTGVTADKPVAAAKKEPKAVAKPAGKVAKKTDTAKVVKKTVKKKVAA